MSGKHPPKIVFITHWAARLGGAEHSLIDLIEYAAKQALVYLITSETGPLTERATAMNVHCIVIPCSFGVQSIRRDFTIRSLLRHGKTATAFFLYMMRVARSLRAIQPSYAHANVPKSHITLLCASLLGYRGSVIIHMRELFGRKSTVLHLYRILFGMVYRARIIAISNAVKNDLPASMRKKTVVIYNGVHIPSIFGKRPALPPVKFLFLGRIVPWKGCDLLVDLFIDLLARYGNNAIQLSLVGDTLYWDLSYRKQIEQRILAASAGSAIQLFGYTDHPEELFSRHHVVCLPSKNEPFGRVAAEAQAAGLPVIGFASGGLPEIVVNGITGILAEDQNWAALASAMCQCIDNPDVSLKMGLCGRERASQMFDAKRQVPEVYRVIVSDNRG